MSHEATTGKQRDAVGQLQVCCAGRRGGSAVGGRAAAWHTGGDDDNRRLGRLPALGRLSPQAMAHRRPSTPCVWLRGREGGRGTQPV